MTQDIRLPGTEAYAGALYELPERSSPGQQEQEVLTELETRKIWANNYHRAAEKDAASMLDNAMNSGDQLIPIRESIEVKRGDGRWGTWVAQNFEGSMDTAQIYMRLARNRKKIEAERSRRQNPLSIDSAVKMLAAPKEDKPEDDPEQPAAVDDVEEQDEVVEQAAPVDTEALERQLAELQRQAREAFEAAKKAQKAKEKAEQKVDKEAAKAAEEARYQYQLRLKTDQEQMRQNLQQELAEVYARYDIQTSPTIFEVDEEHWRAALENTQDRREKEILQILSDLFPSVMKMRNYEPAEAARACLKWPSEERAKEAVGDLAEWLALVSEEMDALTTKGVLRPVGGER